MIVETKNLAEAIKDMKSSTYDFTEAGRCVQCGACCSNYLPMTRKEIATIHRYVKSTMSKNTIIYFRFHNKHWI